MTFAKNTPQTRMATLPNNQKPAFLNTNCRTREDIVACGDGLVCFRYQNAKTGRTEQRTLAGADFLWLVLQHVLPKGFRRARNFGFLHPNCKRLIAVLHVLLKFVPGQSMAWVKERAPILCSCCGAAMVIVKTRIRTRLFGGVPVPIVLSGDSVTV